MRCWCRCTCDHAAGSHNYRHLENQECRYCDCRYHRCSENCQEDVKPTPLERARALLVEAAGCDEAEASGLLLLLASEGLTVVESDLAGAAWKRSVAARLH